MSKNNEEEINERIDFIEKIAEKYSKDMLEEIFGIKVKKVAGEKWLYNVYRDENIVIENAYPWDIELVFEAIAKKFAKTLCSDEN